MIRTLARAALSSLCAAALFAQVQTQPGVNQDALIIQDFTKRVADYVKIHKSAQDQIHRLKPTESPSAIEHYEHRLAHQIQEARHGAARGDIFTPQITAEFNRLLGITLQGPDAVRIRQSLRRAEPVRIGPIRVNGTYPNHIPLQSSPPSLLLNLPPLPPELEYRVVGPALIIRDSEANLVVDFIPNAFS